ncbi:MAG: GspH/FimT family pseudopilin [Comamonadaceae bacterium]
MLTARFHESGSPDLAGGRNSHCAKPWQSAIKPMQRGVTMVELAVVMAIIAILAALAVPSFSVWIQNSQIRNAAEAIQNGIALTRTEAVRRNTLIRFQLTTTVDAGCAISATDANWVISFDDPTGLCANAPINEAFATSDSANNPAPRLIQRHPAAEGSRNAVVAAGQSTIVFNGTGRVTPVPAGAITIDISNPTGGACAATGPMHCLKVVISPGGQARMCDPAIANTDPRGC